MLRMAPSVVILARGQENECLSAMNFTPPALERARLLNLQSPVSNCSRVGAQVQPVPPPPPQTLQFSFGGKKGGGAYQLCSLCLNRAALLLITCKDLPDSWLKTQDG